LISGILRLPQALLAQTAPAAAAPYWWVSPLVVFLGVIVAVIAIFTNRRVARMRATLDLIERTESSEYYSEIRKAFRILIDDPSQDTLKRLADAKNESDRNTGKHIYAYLNHYELVAIGCETGILDEQFYSYWMRTTLVRDWSNAREFIAICRNRPGRPNAAAFVHFERMAERFAAGSHPGAQGLFGPLRRFFDNHIWPAKT
jgi:hypothetical protein